MKGAVERTLACEAAVEADIRYAPVRAGEKLLRFVEPEKAEVIGKAAPEPLREDAGEVIPADAEIVRDIVQGEGLTEMQ